MFSLSTSESKQQQTDNQKKDEGQFFDKGEFPGFVQSEFDRYWGTQTATKTKYLAKLAEQDEFEIPLSPINEQLDDPNADLPTGDLDDHIETRTYKFHDATTKQWQIMQQIRADLAAAEQTATKKLENAPKGGLPEEEYGQVRQHVAEIEAKLYFYQAKIFLRMNSTDFNRADRSKVRDACDAASHRTIISIPNSHKASSIGST